VIVVIGGANIDIKARSLGAAIPRTSNPGMVTLVPGGVARNIAETLARLGAKALLLSAVGADLNGERLMAETAAAGVDLSLMERSAHPTGSYCAVLDAQGELVTAVSDMRAVDDLTPTVLARHREALEAAAYIVADCNLPVASLGWLMRYRDKLVVEPVSVKKSERLLPLIDGQRPILAATPNRDEACAMTSEAEPARAAKLLLARGLSHVMVNLGPDGALAASRSGEMERVPAIGTGAPHCDVTGAGDAATAGLVFSLWRGKSFVDAVRFGQSLAALRLSGSTSSAPLPTEAAE
jgi:pseudouridine kinase